ncbi:hypothetical protein ACF0H5_003706 [Mactra antiquata]
MADGYQPSFGGWENVSSTGNDVCDTTDQSCQYLKLKSLESSARMESLQRNSVKMSEIKENLMINQTGQTSHNIHDGYPQDILKFNLPRAGCHRAVTRNVNGSESLIGCPTIRGDAAMDEVINCRLNRSWFNKNIDTLPSIGKKNSSVDVLINKLTGLNENIVPFSPEPDPLSIISKHETRIRTTSLIRDISKEFVSAAAKLIEPFHQNMAPEIIESNEGKVGRPYQRFAGYPAGSAILHGNYKVLGSRSEVKPGKSPTTHTNFDNP